jgi:methanethiol S-methyltransferase
VPKGIDDGPTAATWLAIVVDLGLLGVFAAQHSVMARPWFKRWWTRFVPAAIERSTYVLAATAMVILLLWQWRPLPDTIWSAPTGLATGLLWTLYAAGWAILVLSTFLIGHFDLFGLRQVLARARERRYAEPGFRRPGRSRSSTPPVGPSWSTTLWPGSLTVNRSHRRR